jgi:tetratricopeptide (TPR) repeat protein
MNEDTPSLLAQAVALHQQGALAPAEALYRRALAAAPRQANALHLLGVLLGQRGRPDEAIPLIAAAVAEAPEEAIFHANLGRARKAAGQQKEALASFDRAITLGSTDPGVFNDRGNVLRDLQHPQAALESFDRAIALRLDYAEAFSNRGNALLDLDRHQEALASYGQAIALRPEYAEALGNRGNALVGLDRHEEALASYGQAIALHPGHADALLNRGGVLSVLGQHVAALQSFDEALTVRPDHPATRFGRSLCLLKMGDLARGWTEYEWRWQVPPLATRVRRFPRPPWLGAEPLAGKTILLRAEQGFGDTLQFCRYAPLVAARGGRVVLAVARPLVRLMATLDGCAQVISERDPVPPYDLHCPLMSLPLAFGTTLETIPPPARVTPPADRVAEWRRRLAPLAGSRVGLCWAGDPRRSDPAANAIDRRRSMTLAHYAPLARAAGASFIALQKGEAAAEIATPPAGLLVRDWTDELHDFADTAALIEALDLVITVDTAVAHLAATLGKPTWILSRYDGCWRWLTGRDDSPWYPSVRLFRQPAPRDWDAVVSAVAAALRDFAPRC